MGDQKFLPKGPAGTIERSRPEKKRTTGRRDIHIMEFQVPISLTALPIPIKYGDKILLTGSCFTENIGNALRDWKFDILQNPNGILFDPASVASSLLSYIQPKRYTETDLFYANELWQSWQHHSIFSHVNQADTVNAINTSQQQAHDFLKKADWLVI